MIKMIIKVLHCLKNLRRCSAEEFISAESQELEDSPFTNSLCSKATVKNHGSYTVPQTVTSSQWFFNEKEEVGPGKHIKPIFHLALRGAD